MPHRPPGSERPAIAQRTTVTYPATTSSHPNVMQMNRRSFLITAGASALSSLGIVNRTLGRHVTQSDWENQTSGVSTPPTDNTLASRCLRADGSTDTASDLNISTSSSPAPRLVLRAELLRDVTENHPARIRVELKNTSTWQLNIVCGSTPPISKYVGRNSKTDARLVLIPDQRSMLAFEGIVSNDGDPFIPERPQRGCWRAKRVPIEPDIATEIRLTPNERLSGTYTVLAHPTMTGCVPSGDYRFEATLTSNPASPKLVLTITKPS